MLLVVVVVDGDQCCLDVSIETGLLFRARVVWV